MIGVSPAYFISRYSDRFTPAEIADGLTAVAQLGCKGFQLEVYHREMLGKWLNGGAQCVRQRSLDLDLVATQFVAHFMMDAFTDIKSLNSSSELEDMQIVLEIVSRFKECRTVTVPLGAFAPGRVSSKVDYRLLFERCSKKIGGLLEMVAKSGRRIFGTHLYDNFGHENLSLRPGAGSIDWPRIINALRAAGYTGPYDLEIICRPEEVQQAYQQAYTFINSELNG